MTLPANIRTNVGAPFPSLVKGSGPISLIKLNGVWTIGYAPILLAPQTPPVSNYPTDYVVVWDDIAKVNFRMSLAQLAAGGGATQRSIVDGQPQTILATDEIIHFNLSAATAITLPSYLTRAGVPLILKDVGNKAAANNITFNCVSPETVDALFNFVVLNQNGQAIKLTPANDGVNTGWFRE